MKMRQNYYNDTDYDRNDDMTITSAHCSHFSRRHDVNAFNMMNYQSCENCRHLTADDQCTEKRRNPFAGME